MTFELRSEYGVGNSGCWNLMMEKATPINNMQQCLEMDVLTRGSRDKEGAPF